MNIPDAQMKNFLQQLYQMSSGEVSADVSMYDIGDALGLDKSEAGGLAEDLIIDGFAELKNLAGGISITSEGIQALGKDSDGSGGQPSGSIVLGEKIIMDTVIAEAVEQLLAEIKSAVSAGQNDYDDLDEMVIDIKTLEIQLLSPRPKTPIVREILSSLSKLLGKQASTTQLAATIRKMIGA